MSQLHYSIYVKIFDAFFDFDNLNNIYETSLPLRSILKTKQFCTDRTWTKKRREKQLLRLEAAAFLSFRFSYNLVKESEDCIQHFVRVILARKAEDPQRQIQTEIRHNNHSLLSLELSDRMAILTRCCFYVNIFCYYL